jgi:hypothetical protein
VPRVINASIHLFVLSNLERHLVVIERPCSWCQQFGSVPYFQVNQAGTPFVAAVTFCDGRYSIDTKLIQEVQVYTSSVDLRFFATYV